MTLMPMLAAPSVIAVKLAPESTVFIFDMESVLLYWLPATVQPVKPPKMPLLAVSVTVRLALSTSATVKSARSAATPVLTLWVVVGTPASVGASLTAVMLTVVLPVALNTPPVPWLPLLPSFNVQFSTTLAGGASLLLVYSTCRATSLTSACVATVDVLLKAMASVPPVWVNVAKVLPPLCKLLPLTVNSAPVVLKPNTSSALAPPLRARVRLAPA